MEVEAEVPAGVRRRANDADAAHLPWEASPELLARASRRRRARRGTARAHGTLDAMTPDPAPDAARTGTYGTDLALVATGTALHLAAAAVLDLLPPGSAVQLLLVGLPVVVAVAAVAALVLRADRRVLQGLAVLEWLLVLFTLPAFFLGLGFVPAAAVLTVAARRPARPAPTSPAPASPPLSSDRSAAG